MAKEIHEQPEVIGDSLHRMVALPGTPPAPWCCQIMGVGLREALTKTTRLTMTAPAATSYYAGMVGRKYWFEKLARLPVEMPISPVRTALSRSRL